MKNLPRNEEYIIESDTEELESEEEETAAIDINPFSRTIKMFGPVDNMTSMTMWSVLENLRRQSDEEITLIINSLGGSVHDMFSIVDLMCMYDMPIKTIGTGLIASAATLILASGTKGRRFLTPNTMVMTHDLQWGAIGGITEILAVADVGKQIQSRYHKMMSKFTGKTLAELKPYLSGKDQWYTANEAIKKIGLADKILTVKELVLE